MTWTISGNGKPAELLNGLDVARQAVYTVMGGDKVNISVTGWDGSLSASVSTVREEQKPSA